MQPGEVVEAGGFSHRFDGMAPSVGPNYEENIGTLTVTRTGTGEHVTVLNPTKRFYQARQQPTTESAIYTHWFSQLYVSLGDNSDANGQVVSVYYKPFITLVWLGCLVMAFGGTLSLSDRRLRVGAPKRAKALEAAT